jgi:hypothetical protein
MWQSSSGGRRVTGRSRVDRKIKGPSSMGIADGEMTRLVETQNLDNLGTSRRGGRQVTHVFRALDIKRLLLKKLKEPRREYGSI